jgi:hypothetical protein
MINFNEAFITDNLSEQHQQNIFVAKMKLIKKAIVTNMQLVLKCLE